MHAANAVVALSEVSKLQLVDRGIDPNKIVVIPNAVEEQFIGKNSQKLTSGRNFVCPKEKLSAV